MEKDKIIMVASMAPWIHVNKSLMDLAMTQSKLLVMRIL